MATAIEDFIGTATDEQREVLTNLSRTGKEEKKLTDEVEAVYKSINTGGVYSLDGHSVTICEDNDNAAIISAGPKKELRIVKEKMATYMKKALELDMGHLGIIQRNYETYVGEPIPKD